jgi:hypothetical protein
MPTPPATFSTRSKPVYTTTRLSHVAIPVKKPRGRPTKNPKAVTTAKPSESALGTSSIPLKRKASLGSQPYETPKSSIKKVLRDIKRRKPSGFIEAPIVLEEDSEDPNYPASPVRRPTRRSASKSASEAVAVGKLSKVANGSRSESMVGGNVTTRSSKASS